jgi:cell division protein FtsZ
MINLDFADVKAIMRDAGSALMAIGRGSGENRCVDAARMAIASPLLEMNIDGATGVLYNITGGGDLSIAEVSEAAEVIRAAADDEAEIIFGTSIDDSLGRDVTITLIATGFQGGRSPRQRPVSERRSQRPYDRERERDREPERDRERERDTFAASPPREPREPQKRTPVLPDDEWAEPAILRFLRERQ